jgi:hypothetical protein
VGEFQLAEMFTDMVIRDNGALQYMTTAERQYQRTAAEIDRMSGASSVASNGLGMFGKDAQRSTMEAMHLTRAVSMAGTGIGRAFGVQGLGAVSQLMHGLRGLRYEMQAMSSGAGLMMFAGGIGLAITALSALIEIGKILYEYFSNTKAIEKYNDHMKKQADLYRELAKAHQELQDELVRGQAGPREKEVDEQIRHRKEVEKIKEDRDKDLAFERKRIALDPAYKDPTWGTNEFRERALQMAEAEANRKMGIELAAAEKIHHDKITKIWNEEDEKKKASAATTTHEVEEQEKKARLSALSGRDKEKAQLQETYDEGAKKYAGNTRMLSALWETYKNELASLKAKWDKEDFEAGVKEGKDKVDAAKRAAEEKAKIETTAQRVLAEYQKSREGSFTSAEAIMKDIDRLGMKGTGNPTVDEVVKFEAQQETQHKELKSYLDNIITGLETAGLIPAGGA